MSNQQAKTPKESILIVDDTPVNLHLLTRILTNQGYDVRLAQDGHTALASARAKPPDLILLDIMMPEMDGYEVCEELKADKNTTDIPVIFISAMNEVLDKVKAFSIGGVDYITKPFQAKEVVARVNTHLTIRHLQKSLQEQNAQLQEALDNVKTLKGLLPICANCKKIRDDQGYWQQVEVYIVDHSDADFSHGVCPDCLTTLYPEFYGKTQK